jgi:hypothetical protein
MLKTSTLLKTPSVDRLVYHWGQRYTHEIPSVYVDNPSLYSSLVETASQKGRALTASRFKDNVINVNCQMAWIQTKTLYNYIPNIVDLSEARRITQFSFRLYRKLVEIYQNQSVSAASSRKNTEGDIFQEQGIPSIEELAYALEPILMIFQEQHLVSKDWRALGFMTTQLNFSNKLIKKKLTEVEQILLNPYLKFVEEQVAMPWQRVCAAAAQYEIGSPSLNLVEQMLPASQEIAESIYHQLVELLPNYRSRRGRLSDKGVKHSCIRDLEMFQAYLWLCFLAENLSPMEKELLPLCEMVVQGVDIKWEVTQKWCQLLGDEILRRVNPQQQALLLPYIEGMQQIFFNERSCLGWVKHQQDLTVLATLS